MTTYIPADRSKFYRDYDGKMATAKRTEEKLSYTLDWSDKLDSDTISSVEYEAYGVTVESSSNTTTTTTFQVSGAGHVIQKLTLASGDTWHRLLRFYSVDSDVTDYG